MGTVQDLRHRTRFYLLVLLPALVIGTDPARAEITMDGTLGDAGPLAGPEYTITDTLGRQVGGNLFHSFTIFNIVRGERATFTGPASIDNVIGRVTGGTVSTIDGVLGSSIPGANLYLINPAGIVFGEHAALAVSGSFHAGSAHYLRLGSDGRFDAVSPSKTVLSVTNPVAFGFLDNDVSPVTVRGALTAPAGQALSFVGGDVRITGAEVTAPGGQVHIAGAMATGEIAIDGASPVSDGIAQLGDIRMDQESTLRVDQPDNGDGGAGTVYIQGNALVMDDSAISSVAHDRDGGGLQVRVREELRLRNDATARVTTEGAAGAGRVMIEAGELVLEDESVIETNTFGQGRGGDIIVEAGERIALSGESFVFSFTEGTGRAGDMMLSAPLVHVVEEAEILSDTEGAGPGGDMVITASRVILDNDAEIASDVEMSGDGGSVTIRAEDIMLLDESEISSDTVGTGDGGTVLLEASDVIRIEGESGVFTDSEGSGSSGTIALRAPLLQMEGGVVTGEANGSGQGGGVSIQAGQVVLRSGAIISSQSAGTGNAGDILLTQADSIRVEAGSAITTEAENADGGNIQIEARDLVYILDSDVTAMVAGGTGSGGNISIDPTFVALNGATITADAFGGDGGNITIRADHFLASPDSVISASSALGIDGTIFVDAPDTDITGGIAPLSEAYLDATALLREHCAVRRAEASSSFLAVGLAGVRPGPDTYLPVLGNRGQTTVFSLKLSRAAGGPVAPPGQNASACAGSPL